MQALKNNKFAWLIGAVSLVGVAVGLLRQDYYSFGLGAAGLCYAILRVMGWAPRRGRVVVPGHPTTIVAEPQPETSDAPEDTMSLVELMLTQGRYSLLLRPEIVPNLTESQYGRARVSLFEQMALVPEGELIVGQVGETHEQLEYDPRDVPRCHGSVVRVERFYLDRYPVTNRQFQAFVSAGGYEQMAIWEPDIWPGVLEFVDQTGAPGPRYWKKGHHEPGAEDHPVTGICWYEAAAFARWIGKRLPTDPEWEKAGSWPVQLTASKRPQRRYPWGDTLDRKRANLWGSGPNKVVSVYDFSEGVSVGGVHQLIGNVWEWTTGNFGEWCYPGGGLVLATPVKCIRGGAYDTYFDNQATCQFQSGEDPVARKHNIGFRCAVSVCDLALAGAPRSSETREPDADEETAYAAHTPEACVT